VKNFAAGTTQFGKPYRVVSWDKGGPSEGREREATLKKVNRKARFTGPVPEPIDMGGPKRIWVNEGGSEVTVGLKGEPGEPIYIKVTLDKDNFEGDPAKVISEFLDHKTETKDGCDVISGRLTAGETDGKARFYVDMGQAGGNLVTIEIGTTEGEVDALHALQSWRRIYVSMLYSEYLDVPNIAKASQALHKAYVFVMPAVDPIRIADDKKNSQWWYSIKLPNGESRRRLTAGTHNAQTLYQLAMKDVDSKVKENTLVLCFADTTFDWTQAISAGSINLNEGNVQQVAWPGQGNVAGFKVRLAGAHIPLQWWDGSGSIQALVGSENQEVRFPDETLLERSNLYSGFDVKLSDNAYSQIVAGGTITLVYKYRLADTAQGFAMVAYPFTAISTRGSLSDRVSMTVAHELGHAMGMSAIYVKHPSTGVPQQQVATGLKEHPYFYIERGHLGPHCGFGVAGSTFNSDKLLRGAGGKCIMFGEVGEEMDTYGAFCPDCETHLKAHDLTDLSTYRFR
jgi:hypothetical protein